MQEEITIENAAPEDAAALLRIYAPYVEETAITFEYTVPTEAEFRSRIEQTLQKYPYLVARQGDRISAYAYASAFHPRAAYQWCAELSVYVDRGYRKGGIGGRLYRAMEARLREMGILNLNACIAVPREGSPEDPHLSSNSMDFHAHMGYQLVGRFHDCGYKFDTWYDMIWMEKLLGEHPGKPAPVRWNLN